MRACFRCGWLGDMIGDCPNNAQGSGATLNIDNKLNLQSQIPARVYSVTLGDVDANAPETKEAGVITDIFLDLLAINLS